MRVLPTLAAALFACAAAFASDRPVVVELFTSQGCSSCPPADVFMEELAKRDDVIALTMPVDIWDYLGWRDTFARHEFTLRQQAYAPKMPSRSVFTPQMVIGGVSDVVGSKRARAEEIIASVADMRGGGVAPSLTLEGETLVVETPAVAGLENVKATVYLAHVLSQGLVEIGDGENRGHRITYWNVVREWTPLGEIDVGAGGRFEAPARGAKGGADYDRAAVIVQKDGLGPILGATMIALPAP